MNQTPIAMESPLPILYLDHAIVAVHKPSGLLVHRSPIDRHETVFALQQVRDQLGRWVYPVYRLDKPTSGVLLFALERDMARALSEQFAEHRVGKHYLAVVRGYCPESGEIDHALRDKADPLIDRHRSRPAATQSALTRYQRLATVEIPVEVDRYPQSRYSLVDLFPRTGRKHQLRRHMKHIGHPIIGDAKHGKGVHNRYFQQAYACHRLLLACYALEVEHPETGLSLRIEAPLEGSFLRVLETFGWEGCIPV